MVRNTLGVVVLAALALVAGCAGQKEPATQALASVEASLTEVKDDATRFAKDKLDAAETKLAELKASFEQKKYKDVVAGVPELQKDVTSIKEDVAAKKVEFEQATARATETWNGYAAELPAQVETLQKRIDQLVKQRKVEKGVSEESLLLDNVKNLWADAGNLFGSGQAIEAAAKAEEAKLKIAELAGKLKVKL